MNVLDLFSGIGGFSLGLERAGMRTVAFCEIEPYCRAVLRKHWPDVPCYTDVRELTAARLAADGIPPADVICGGFPCQDISFAGDGAGLAGERSGLFFEIVRIVRELRGAGRPPIYIMLENVAALVTRGLGDVLAELAALGYDTEWNCIPAFAVGAPHRRDRIWIVAYPSRDVRAQQAARRPERQRIRAGGEPLFHSDTISERLEGQLARWTAARAANRPGDGSDPCWWVSEPDVGRVAHGIPGRVDRLRSLGNAVVPQIPEIIGRAIMMQVGSISSLDAGMRERA